MRCTHCNNDLQIPDGSFCGQCGNLITYPADAIRKRLQNDDDSLTWTSELPPSPRKEKQYRVASPYDLEHIPPPPPLVTNGGKIKRKPLIVVLVVLALLLVFPLCSQYYNTQATATAAQSTAIAQQQEQQAVQVANQQLANDLSSLQQEINTLAQFSESNTLQGYAKDWKQMQDDYATEQQQAQQGCGLSNSNQNQVQADANQVGADYNQIMADDNQFNADKTQYNLETTAQAAVQTDMQNVQNDWTQLKQAVDYNPSGTPRFAKYPQAATHWGLYQM